MGLIGFAGCFNPLGRFVDILMIGRPLLKIQIHNLTMPTHVTPQASLRFQPI